MAGSKRHEARPLDNITTTTDRTIRISRFQEQYGRIERTPSRVRKYFDDQAHKAIAEAEASLWIDAVLAPTRSWATATSF